MGIEEVIRPMIRHSVVVAAAALLFATAARAQNSTESNSSSPPAASSQQEKTKLMEATRVSTDGAARKVAEQETKQKNQNRAEKQHSDKASDVVELHPAAKSEADSDVATRGAGASKKSPLKKIHGSVYGAEGANNRRTGASAGASTNSGNTHIYVETDRSKQDAPH
jgi:hypothetical protein